MVKVHKVIGDKKVFVFKGFNESEDKVHDLLRRKGSSSR